MKDMKNNMDAQHSIIPAAAFTATTTGSSVDLKGFAGAMAVFNVGAADTGNADETYIPGLEESSDNSTFTAVAAADIEGDVSTLLQNSVRRLGYKGNKRYIKAKITIGGTTPSVIAGGLIVRGRPESAPVA